MKKRYIPFILFLGVAGAFFVQLMRNANGDDPKALESALIGKAMPKRPMQDLWGNPLNYDTLFKTGKPVLVNIWATWCPTCYAEHQFLDQLAKQGVSIIGIDYKDGIHEAQRWLRQYGNPYLKVIDDSQGDLGLDLGVYGTPETFFIDGKGIIRYRFAGNLNPQAWQTIFLPLYQRYTATQGNKQ